MCKINNLKRCHITSAAVKKRTSDSCNVNLPIKLVKIKFLRYPRIPIEICSPQLPLAGYNFIF